MKRKYVELECDYCGQTEIFFPGDVNRDARLFGWVITRDGHYFDCKECYEDFRGQDNE